MLKFMTGITSGKPPADHRRRSIALSFKSPYLFPQFHFIRYSTLQTLVCCNSLTDRPICGVSERGAS